MKLQLLLAAAVITASGGAWAAGKHDHAHAHQPMHGGVVVEVKDMDYELVARPTTIQVHVRDHGKPADVSKASAKVTLLTGPEKQEVELKPNGDRLEARGTFRIAAGTKVVAVVNLDGKSASVRFTLK